MSFEHYYRPTELTEAIELLEQDGFLPLAGGTSMTLRRQQSTASLVSLAGLGLKELSPTSVEAMVTLSQLQQYEAEQESMALLQAAAAVAAAAPIRNRATVAASAVVCFRWSDLPAALLAMNATFVIVGKDGQRQLAARDLYARHPRRSLHPGEVVTSITLPTTVRRWAFNKHVLTRFSHAIWDVAIVEDENRAWQIALSGGTALPVVAEETSRLVAEAGPAIDTAVLASALAHDEAQGCFTIRGSSGYPAAYRRQVLPVLVGDLLSRWKTAVFCAAMFAFLWTAVLTSSTMAAPQEPLTLFYTGSARGDLGSLTGGVQSETIGLLQRLRMSNDDLLALCAGDMLGPSVTSDLDEGQLMVAAMNACGFVASGLGPHDLGYGWQSFCRRTKEAQFPFLCANLLHGDIRPTDISAHHIVEQGNRQVFVTAVMSPTLPARWPAWPTELSITNAIEAVKAQRSIATTCDFVVVLSSMEFEENMHLLKAIPWVDYVISTIVVGNSLIDKSFRDVSLVDGRRLLWTFHSGKTAGLLRTVRQEAKLDSTLRLFEVAKEANRDTAFAERIRQLEDRTVSEQGTCICTLTDDEVHNVQESFLAALRHELHADIAFMDHSSFRTKHVTNCLTKSSIRRVYPYRSRGALLSLSGNQIRGLWQRRNEPLIWNTGLVFVGLSERRGKLLINGRVLHNNRHYRVATSEYLALGSLGLVEPQRNAVGNRSLASLFEAHFTRMAAVDRKKLYRRYEARPILRRSLKLDISYERLYFGGSADQYQYSDPSTVGLGSDIPGLVGNAHDALRFDIEGEAVVDTPRDDLTVRLDLTYKTWNDSRSVDAAEFTIRREATAIDQRPQLFGEFKLTGTLRPPTLAGRRHPMFGKTVAGLVWKLNDNSKLLAGLGSLSRFSQPDNPNSLGLNVQYEVKRRLRRQIELSTAFDLFASLDDDDVRMADFDVQLRFMITRGLSTVFKLRRFLWHDEFIDETALRSEVFIGFGLTRRFRRF